MAVGRYVRLEFPPEEGLFLRTVECTLSCIRNHRSNDSWSIQCESANRSGEPLA